MFCNFCFPLWERKCGRGCAGGRGEKVKGYRGKMKKIMWKGVWKGVQKGKELDNVVYYIYRKKLK